VFFVFVFVLFLFIVRMAEQASHGLAAVISCSGNSPSVPSSVAAGIPLLCRHQLQQEFPFCASCCRASFLSAA